ncbi:DUF2920 family protein [Campylobacter sp. IFREMER_LSEM_CL292]|uniref:DUF2920 family protein n=1 Tax=Campylobacter sp. IFREMER_LSEM_CL292 TaxID=2911623 RepID=UPI00298800EA|nr:DUF2920 family protein [Campylobacter sp. IFREMER_LSEM_CL292]
MNFNTHGLNTWNMEEYLVSLESTIDTYKLKGVLANDYKFFITSTMLPANNEYQNYGIMAAIDCINSLKDLCKNFPDFRRLPKIYGGGSYGGYLSLLISKIAPWRMLMEL